LVDNDRLPVAAVAMVVGGGRQLIALGVHTLLVGDVVAPLLRLLFAAGGRGALGGAHNQTHAGTSSCPAMATKERADDGAEGRPGDRASGDVVSPGLLGIGTQRLIRICPAGSVIGRKLRKTLAGAGHDRHAGTRWRRRAARERRRQQQERNTSVVHMIAHVTAGPRGSLH